ncbi:MAG: peptidoglycan-associated lipoprotein Pal [Deltaproteobacteria bacterium]|nr:peptidoglycan-associated lipoprotein Pal [Deltaproteobacteria bacterium]
MKKNSLLIFTLVIAGLFFMAAGCAKVVKEEEIKKSAEPAAGQTQEEKAAKAKEEAAAVKEEKIAEQPVKEAPVSEATAKAEKEASAKAEAGGEIAELARGKGMLLAVYFDFDRFTIRDDMKSVLEKNVEWLKKNSAIAIQIQGNCDERGSNEYNIALGERRAQSIKEYLINYGIKQSRLSTVSYGEEKPADPGHTEEAWAKNRRGEFVIVK